jgi:hypothetical protein
VIDNYPRARVRHLSREHASNQRRERLLDVAAAVVQVRTTQPGMGVRKLRAAVRALRGRCADNDTTNALSLLGNSLKMVVDTRGGYQLSVDAKKLPAEVRARVKPARTAA